MAKINTEKQDLFASKIYAVSQNLNNSISERLISDDISIEETKFLEVMKSGILCFLSIYNHNSDYLYDFHYEDFCNKLEDYFLNAYAATHSEIYDTKMALCNFARLFIKGYVNLYYKSLKQFSKIDLKFFLLKAKLSKALEKKITQIWMISDNISII